MFKEIKNFFNQPNEGDVENKVATPEKIKSSYGRKLAMLALLTVGGASMNVDKVLGQEQKKVDDTDPENIPTLHFENGATASPNIIPIDILKIGGVIEVYLGKDYEIMIRSKDPRDIDKINTLRPFDKLSKGFNQIHFDKKFIYIIRDPETGKSFTVDGLGLTDEDIEEISHLSPGEVEKAKERAEKLAKDREKQLADSPLTLNKNFEENLQDQIK